MKKDEQRETVFILIDEPPRFGAGVIVDSFFRVVFVVFFVVAVEVPLATTLVLVLVVEAAVTVVVATVLFRVVTLVGGC